MLKTLLAGTAAAAAAFGLAIAQDTVAITHAQLHMTDADGAVIEDGTLIIRNGRIAAVGTGIEVPSDARIIDAQGRPVTPGLFVPLSGIGLTEIGAVSEANDISTNNEALTSSLRAIDGFNYDTSTIDVTRAGGITRAYAGPNPGPTLFGGCGVVLAMVRGQEAIMEPCTSQMAVLGETAAQRTGGSRQAAFATFRRAIEDALAYDEDPVAYGATDSHNRLSVEDARALVPVALGQEQVLVDVHGASDILRVLELRNRYDLDIVLVGATEAYRVADALAQARVPVILNPLANLPQSFEQMGATLEAAGRLAAAGVKVTFYDSGIGYTHNARLLPQLAGNAVAGGMGHADAMRAVTLTPAEIYGVADDLGTLERGKLADVVVWEGDPFEVTVRPRHVFIEGVETSLENRQSLLAERYRDLSRGDLPFQYRQ